jgi:hypothetical protein
MLSPYSLLSWELYTIAHRCCVVGPCVATSDSVIQQTEKRTAMRCAPSVCAGYGDAAQEVGTAERLYPGGTAWADAGTTANSRTKNNIANQRLAVVLP